MAQLLSKPVKHIASAPAIHADGVSLRYEDIYVLRVISLALPAVEHFAGVGPISAGKSTLFKILAGL